MAGKRRKEAKGKRGAPTSYTEEKAATICAVIAEGGTLKASAQAVGVTAYAVKDWLHRHPDFATQYARAREEQADHFADEIVEISDAAMRLKSPQAVNAARLRVDSRKWAAAHLRPKKWGDRLIHAGDPEAPVNVNLRGEWSEIIRGSQDRELSGPPADPVE